MTTEGQEETEPYGQTREGTAPEPVRLGVHLPSIPECPNRPGGGHASPADAGHALAAAGSSVSRQMLDSSWVTSEVVKFGRARMMRWSAASSDMPWKSYRGE